MPKLGVEFVTLNDRENGVLVSEVKHFLLLKKKVISEIYDNEDILVLGGGILPSECTKFIDSLAQGVLAWISFPRALAKNQLAWLKRRGG